MQSKATTVDAYMKELPADRLEAMTKLRKVIRKNIPKGFQECMNYGMIGFVVPHKLYAEGYHCDPSMPLPFMNIASQKNNISVYHMGIYADQKILKWFEGEYKKLNIGKLDMGKSCIRFKNMDKIPYDLIGQLAAKITVDEWVGRYEEMKMKRK
ncbi:MAG: DUF1801 domain-containing protein [Chitinophagaceae bacterium]|nr:DUF1801 domain-containing protein [Chitinophagaceae bacterium]MBN8667185.1 DUF1801 domain-containing protein [Chitinophagales bacterium]